jgi:hypothetical protein
MEKATPAATATPLSGLDADWFDPLEDAVRGQVRVFIEQLLEEELEAALGRGRYERGPASTGHRNGHRDRRLDTTFGPLVAQQAAAGLPASEPARRAADRPSLPRRGQHPAGAPGAPDPVRRPDRQGCGEPRLAQDARSLGGLAAARSDRSGHRAADPRRYRGQSPAGSQGDCHLAADRARDPA